MDALTRRPSSGSLSSQVSGRVRVTAERGASTRRSRRCGSYRRRGRPLCALAALASSWRRFRAGTLVGRSVRRCRCRCSSSAFAAAELVAVHIESRGEAHALTFVEIPYVAGLLLGGADGADRRRACSAAFLVLGVVRRQSLHKLLVNLARRSRSRRRPRAVVFSAAHRRRCRRSRPSGWLGIFAALLAGVPRLGASLVTLAITVFSGWPGRPDGRARSSWSARLVPSRNTAIGIARRGLALGRVATRASWCCGVVAVLFVLYRAYTGLTERHKNLETLHDFTRSLGDAIEIDGPGGGGCARARGRSCVASTSRCCCRPSATVCRRPGCSSATTTCIASQRVAQPAGGGPRPAPAARRGAAVRAGRAAAGVAR